MNTIFRDFTLAQQAGIRRNLRNTAWAECLHKTDSENSPPSRIFQGTILSDVLDELYFQLLVEGSFRKQIDF
jgi:hypothetical protein